MAAPRPPEPPSSHGEVIQLNAPYDDHLLCDLPDGEVRGAVGGVDRTCRAGFCERVQVGPLVASTSSHAPAVPAKLAATVDAISGGRLILGVGAGWNQREETAFGFPYDKRISRFEEAFTTIRELVRTGRSKFAASTTRFRTMSSTLDRCGPVAHRSCWDRSAPHDAHRPPARRRVE
jgi:alkanesulfonate monooxygenase SsuD/methylene tetrahydromethanopterin reductase-like flavin-dependent oxidoreductase (luciferase family)